MKGTVSVQLTNGFGNNIFQYTAAKLLAEYLDSNLLLIPPSKNYYAIPDLQSLGMDFTQKTLTNPIKVLDKHYKSCYNKVLKGRDVILSGYFEDYTIYFDHIEKIKSWFPKSKNRNDNSLTIHMRTGDRLFMKNEFYTKPRAKNYLKAIEKFDFDELHIVTDMPKWDYVTGDELNNMKFHLNVPQSERVPIEESVKFFNELVGGFEKYNPKIKQRTIVEDFNFIRESDNILFEHGTLSWWAAVLSDAKKVGVYGPWRPWKGTKNKNLSKIPLKNWFKWE
tara:strand:+ start:830 stop:1666 length:837 start_codon:yes stop_codon:yes gene_type:complete